MSSVVFPFEGLQSATSVNTVENAAAVVVASAADDAVVEAKSAVTPVVISPIDCRIQCKKYCGPGQTCCAAAGCVPLSSIGVCLYLLTGK